MIQSTIPNHAEALVDAVGARLRGVLRMLETVRANETQPETELLLVAEDAIAGQIDTLEEHLRPIVTGQPVLLPVGRCVPRG